MLQDNEVSLKVRIDSQIIQIRELEVKCSTLEKTVEEKENQRIDLGQKLAASIKKIDFLRRSLDDAKQEADRLHTASNKVVERLQV